MSRRILYAVLGAIWLAMALFAIMLVRMGETLKP
jgi:hypothetical protein